MRARDILEAADRERKLAESCRSRLEARSRTPDEIDDDAALLYLAAIATAVVSIRDKMDGPGNSGIGR